jgi:hypothetical protein
MAHMDTATCKNCKRYFGNIREIIQGANGMWVHNNRLYDVKCNPFENQVAEPLEKK